MNNSWPAQFADLNAFHIFSDMFVGIPLVPAIFQCCLHTVQKGGISKGKEKAKSTRSSGVSMERLPGSIEGASPKKNGQNKLESRGT